MAPSKTTRTSKAKAAGKRMATRQTDTYANRTIPDSQPDEQPDEQAQRASKRKVTTYTGANKRARTGAIPDSEADTPAIRRTTRSKNLLEEQFESSPVLPGQARDQRAVAVHETPDVQFEAPYFDTAIHSRQPEVLTYFRFRDKSPIRPTFGSLIPPTSPPDALRSSPRLPRTSGKKQAYIGCICSYGMHPMHPMKPPSYVMQLSITML
jgi:hypothetical protein